MRLREAAQGHAEMCLGDLKRGILHIPPRPQRWAVGQAWRDAARHRVGVGTRPWFQGAGGGSRKPSEFLAPLRWVCHLPRVLSWSPHPPLSTSPVMSLTGQGSQGWPFPLTLT